MNPVNCRSSRAHAWHWFSSTAKDSELAGCFFVFPSLSLLLFCFLFIRIRFLLSKMMRIWAGSHGESFNCWCSQVHAWPWFSLTAKDFEVTGFLFPYFLLYLLFCFASDEWDCPLPAPLLVRTALFFLVRMVCDQIGSVWTNVLKKLVRVDFILVCLMVHIAADPFGSLAWLFDLRTRKGFQAPYLLSPFACIPILLIIICDYTSVVTSRLGFTVSGITTGILDRTKQKCFGSHSSVVLSYKAQALQKYQGKSAMNGEICMHSNWWIVGSVTLMGLLLSCADKGHSGIRRQAVTRCPYSRCWW